VEIRCPACDKTVSKTFDVDFPRSGSDDTDHARHLAAEKLYARRHLSVGEGMGGRYTSYVPDFFKDHIKWHEEWAYKSGAVSRDSEIGLRLNDLNKRAEGIVAQLTTEILQKRQQECKHDTKRRWVSGESGKTNLLCTGCFKVLDVKFVGTSMQRGESASMKIVDEN
jgi:hypothetical protein